MRGELNQLPWYGRVLYREEGGVTGVESIVIVSHCLVPRNLMTL